MNIKIDYALVRTALLCVKWFKVVKHSAKKKFNYYCPFNAIK